MRHNRSSEGGNDRHHPDTRAVDRSFWERENSSKGPQLTFTFRDRNLWHPPLPALFSQVNFRQPPALCLSCYASNSLSELVGTNGGIRAPRHRSKFPSWHSRRQNL